MTLADNPGTSKTGAADHQRMVLRETLRLAVPMHMVELHDLPPHMLTTIATASATTIGSHGDALQYGGKHCREAFNALARGLAAAALTAQGGVDFAGLHWCADPWCRAGSRMDHAPDVDGLELAELADEDEPAVRSIVDIYLPEEAA